MGCILRDDIGLRTTIRAALRAKYDGMYWRKNLNKPYYSALCRKLGVDAQILATYFDSTYSDWQRSGAKCRYLSQSELIRLMGLLGIVVRLEIIITNETI